MRRLFFCPLIFVLWMTISGFAQQTDIPQFGGFAAHSYLNTSSLNLVQRGFDGDLGINLRPWLTFGFDFSYFTGHSSLLPGHLSAAALAKLPPLPPNLTLAVPYHSATYTYEAGPQFNYRRFKRVTFFVRPALGALHAKFASTSTDPVVQQVVTTVLNGKTSASDTVLFYGFGGGVTFEVHPHLGLRVATDFARYNFFSDVLNGTRNSVRLSIGTRFGFGKNILQNK